MRLKKNVVTRNLIKHQPKTGQKSLLYTLFYEKKQDILPEPVIIFFSSGLMLLIRRLLQTVLILLAPVTQKSLTNLVCVLRICNEKYIFCVYSTYRRHSQLEMVDVTRSLTLYNSFYLKQIDLISKQILICILYICCYISNIKYTF